MKAKEFFISKDEHRIKGTFFPTTSTATGFATI
jgi:hypothetical protein